MKASEKKKLTTILKKLCKEHGVDEDNVFISDFGYVETVDHSKKDVDYKRTIYRGVEYQVKYFDGCFNPFIVEVIQPYKPRQ